MINWSTLEKEIESPILILILHRNVINSSLVHWTYHLYQVEDGEKIEMVWPLPRSLALIKSKPHWMNSSMGVQVNQQHLVEIKNNEKVSRTTLQHQQLQSVVVAMHPTEEQQIDCVETCEVVGERGGRAWRGGLLTRSLCWGLFDCTTPTTSSCRHLSTALLLHLLSVSIC